MTHKPDACEKNPLCTRALVKRKYCISTRLWRRTR